MDCCWTSWYHKLMNLTIRMLGNIACFCVVCWVFFFSKLTFSEKIFHDIISVILSNSFDPDKAQYFVRSKMSADNKSQVILLQWAKKSIILAKTIQDCTFTKFGSRWRLRWNNISLAPLDSLNACWTLTLLAVTIIKVRKGAKIIYRYNQARAHHTGKCIRRFGGIYTYCRYFIDRKW